MSNPRPLNEIEQALKECGAEIADLTEKLKAVAVRRDWLWKEFHRAEAALASMVGSVEGRRVRRGGRTLEMNLAVCSGHRVRYALRLGKSLDDARAMALERMTALAGEQGAAVPQQAQKRLEEQLLAHYGAVAQGRKTAVKRSKRR